MSGLNQSTKDFFIHLINRQIQEKIDSIKASIGMKKMEELALNTWLEDKGILSVYEKAEKLDKEYEHIRNLRDNAQDELRTEYRNKTGGHSGYGFGYDNIRKEAIGEYLDDILHLKHPEDFTEIERLKKIKQNVEAVVLLQTSPTRLQEALSELLNKYGVEVTGIDDSFI